MSSLEERLERLERLVLEVLGRLEELGALLSGLEQDDELSVVRLAARLSLAFSMPALAAIEGAERIIKSLKPGAPRDEISLAVLEALSPCKPLSISEITRSVRASRGKASRRIVRERVYALLRAGSVVNVGSESRPKLTLRVCLEKPV